MKLLRLRAEGFGALRGEWEFDPDRLNLIVDENERGKSTLLAAIAAGLYGLDRDQRTHKVMTPLERWRPWEGGDYRVELELECGGERYVVTRDFERHTVAVWDGRGRERTEEFREGRDQFPVGKYLAGLDAAEFEKCAFLRQGELGGVVPDDERDRRDSSLRTRLENAADTRAADTSATEALKVLERAASRYECAEASANPMKVESAIQRLEARRLRIDTDLAALDSDLMSLAGPLEELADLADRERATRIALERTEVERRSARARELAHQLRRDDERCRELAALREEAARLAQAPRLDEAAEAELRALAVERQLAGDRRAELVPRRVAALDEERMLEQRVAAQAALALSEARHRAGVEKLVAVDRARRRLAVPGWIALALGVAGACAGAAGTYLEAPGPWGTSIVGGAALVLIGSVLLVGARARRRRERAEAASEVGAAEMELRSFRTEQVKHPDASERAEDHLRWDLERARAECRRLESELHAIESLLGLAHARMALLFREAGLPFDPRAPFETQMEAATDAAARAARLELLDQELAPGAAARVLDDDTRAGLEAEIEALARATSRDGSSQDAAAPAIERGLAEIEAEIARGRGVVEDLARKRADQAARFDERARALREERSEQLVERLVVERALRRAVRFKSAVDLARATLSDVAWSTHRRWAAFLNERVGVLLARFGTEIGEVRFGDDLDFSLRLPHGSPAPRGRALLLLSSGARDQLHLAVRIAVSEFLSPHGVPLPLLLDDCFVTSDDERTAAGMKLLIERIAPERQVLLVTCHRARHRALAAKDPDAWRTKVRWVEIATAGVTAR